MSNYPPSGYPPSNVPPGYGAPPAPQSGGAAFGLGLAAVICGAIALLGAWIPFCGVFTLPLSGIGLILGIIGLILALTQKGKPMLPIVGSAISLIALILPFVATGLFAHQAKGWGDQLNAATQRAQQELERQTKEAQERANHETPTTEPGQ